MSRLYLRPFRTAPISLPLGQVHRDKRLVVEPSSRLRREAWLLIAQSDSFSNRNVCAFALRFGESALRGFQQLESILSQRYRRVGPWNI